jgi:hypothetical protein
MDYEERKQKRAARSAHCQRRQQRRHNLARVFGPYPLGYGVAAFDAAAGKAEDARAEGEAKSN